MTLLMILRVFLPYDHITSKTFCLLELGGYIGQTITDVQSNGTILLPTVSGSAGNYYVDIDGDLRGRNLIIGYIYEMTIQLPTFFVGQSGGQNQYTADATADLIIHRLKVSTGLSGPVTYTVDITGKDSWDNVVTVTLPNSYKLGSVNLSASAEHVVPVFQRNKNTKITIKGDTAFPVSLDSLTWEGNYNTRFYRRA